MSRTKEGRDALRSSEAHPQTWSIAPPWPERSQGRVPVGRHRPKSAETGETHPLPGAGLRPVRRRGAALLCRQPPLTHIVLASRQGSSTKYTITGPSILDSNYCHRDVALAESGIRKLERFVNRSQPLETK